MSKIYSVKFEQALPISLQEAWDFISSPHNLKVITPDYMKFEVTNEAFSENMYPGMVITYKVRPLFNIPLNWCTEITHVNHLHYFVDEQRFGPYSFWHHQHHIKEVDGGVLMTDIVHYKIPFGWLGDIANFLFIKSQLNQIFDYRFKKLNSLFIKK
jgi:ligand-binding SRPBCC domain-containing protein